jgi:hypothetical protein
MPTARSLIAALAFAFTAVSCSDDKGPTTGPNAPLDNAPEMAKGGPTQSGPIVQQVSGLVITDPVSGLTGSFTGTATITSFATTATGDLLATVTLAGDLVGAITGGTTETVNQTFTNVLVDAQRCPILNLDIGRILLNVLGLEVDIAPISIDVTAVAGPGNLLGNLLCALVGLLDQNPLAAQVTLLLQQINAILAGILN